ncbi:MAG: magnesium/cobalt transporter CorA [Prevotellaceae bacterium]|jgi:magnesium transporter|nr:magnesium/cobalt transporter CorA [Prevotellaceae bacterium]
MVNYYIKENSRVTSSANIEQLNELSYDEVLWIDMISPTIEERSIVEEFLNINLQTQQQAEEIESSSRYYETESTLYANTSFLLANKEHELSSEQVSFILCEGVLVSIRPPGLRAFNETIRRLYANHRLYPTCFHVMVSILESRIDIDADMLEALAKEVTIINKQPFEDKSEIRLDSQLLLTINRLQENTMMMRESIIDKQRVVSSILKSDRFPSDTTPKLNIIIKDISSLVSYADFAFERLEFLQNTVMGLISLEQNKVIKIFTVATVVFMPPTLISGIYGMNFHAMPELTWRLGYPFAILLMALSVSVILIYFRVKKLL